MDNQWNTGDSPDPFQKREESSSPSGAPAFSGLSPVNGQELNLDPRHSGLGIASFSIFGVMLGAFIVLLILAVGLLADNNVLSSDLTNDEISSRLEDLPQLAVLGFLMMATFFGNFVGLILGIIGLAQKERKKIFAILGTVFNGLVIALLMLFFLIAIAASA